MPNYDGIIAEAENRDIKVAWSNPCIEIWFLAYYGIMPDGLTSVQCCERFGAVFKNNTGEAYNKNDSAIYRKLLESGDEEKAVKVALDKFNKWDKQRREENTPYSKMNACTRMFEIVAEIRSKTGY